MRIYILDRPGEQILQALPDIRERLPLRRSQVQEVRTSQSLISSIFHQALQIRWEVFVEEQHCNAENEIDADDPRSIHFIVFVNSEDMNMNGNDIDVYDIASERSSVPTSIDPLDSSYIPASTLRLIPWSGMHDGIKLLAGYGEPDYAHSGKWDGREPYVLLGRVATVKPYRKRGLARCLIDHCLEYAANHADSMIYSKDCDAGKTQDYTWPSDSSGPLTPQKWRGLVCAHAQMEVLDWYFKLGFELDSGMGKWMEEGIEHMAVWKRVVVTPKSERVLSRDHAA